MRHFLWSGILFVGCQSKMDEETVKSVIEAAFQEANSTDGRYGWELVGKTQWFDGSDFDSECFTESELAYRNYKTVGQITPSYPAQQFITASSKKGYCLDLGGELSYSISSIEHVTEGGSMDIQNVHLRFELQDTTPWFSCLKEDRVSRIVRVENLTGTPMLNPKDHVLFQEKNGCPNPIPKYEKRNPTARPTTEAAKAPTLAEVKALAQKFDEALFERDFEKAMGLVSCVNLFETSKWGTCALVEVLSLGPSVHTDTRMENPWLEGALDDFGTLKKVMKDKADPTLFHVVTQGKRKRSLSVQWANGRWKLLGVVSIHGQGLTPLRFMNDLHDNKNRDVFDRRLAGEKIDHKGNPINPYEEEEEE